MTRMAPTKITELQLYIHDGLERSLLRDVHLIAPTASRH